MRVYEIASELGMTATAVVDLCKMLGIGVSGTNSSLIDAQADRVRARAKREFLGFSQIESTSDEDFSEKHEVQLVIFDLDGTLAKTESLPPGMRTPFQLLEPDGMERDKDWSFGFQTSSVPEQLMLCGYKVAIATRAPVAYASTLIHLLGISAQMLRASCGPSISDKAVVIKEIALEFKIPLSNVLYVGDLEVDKSIAEMANCQFASAADLHSGKILVNLRNRKLETLKAQKEGLFDEIELKKQDEGYRYTINNTAYFETTYSDSDGEFQTQTYTKKNIDSEQMLGISLQCGIPDLNSHAILMRQLFRAEQYDSKMKAGAAFFSLLARPNSPSRSYWQKLLFENIGIEAWNCLTTWKNDGLFQVDPRLISRREIRETNFAVQSESSGAKEYLTRLKEVLPGSQVEIGPPENRLLLQAAVKFSLFASELGSVLTFTKNYSKRDGSGPNVHLGNLDLIADVLVSYIIGSIGISNLGRIIPVIVPVPSSGFNNMHVGQVSNRLAREVAARIPNSMLWSSPIVRNLTTDEIFMRRVRAMQVDQPQFVGHKIVIVEDQSTTGNSVLAIADALRSVGAQVDWAVAFSTSLFNRNVGVLFQQERKACYFDKFSKRFDVDCRCSQT